MVEYQHVRNGDGARGRNDASPRNQCDAGFQPSGLTNGSLPSPARDVSNLSGAVTDPIAKLAASLTKAQRDAILRASVLFPGCWVFPLGSARGMIPLGLGVRTIDGVALTNTGLAVRRHLQAGGA